MDNQEFSDKFDVLYNNIMSNQAPGLDEYEKSVFLTKAQDEIVKDYFNPKLNKVQEGFDQNQRRQIDFSMLIKTVKGNEVTGETSLFPLGHTKYFSVPDKIMMFINESLAVTRNGTTKYLNIVPLDYTEYARLMSKPFKRPLKNQAWRLITNTKISEVTTVTDYATIAAKLSDKYDGDYDTFYNTINGKTIYIDAEGYINVSNNFKLLDNGSITKPVGSSVEEIVLTQDEISEYSQYINRETKVSKAVVEIIPGPVDTITSYTIRYVKRPQAIILAELEGVTLDGSTEPQECELDEILHEEILQRAVELAKASYSGTLADTVQLGAISQTPIGIVTSNSK